MIEQIPNLASYSAIFYGNMPANPFFRTDYYGSKLGPPVTLTEDLFDEWIAEGKRRLAALRASILSRQTPPPDAPPLAPGENPT